MTEKRARVSRAVWAKRVERWQDSGLSAPEFARELGISAATLTYWKYTLKKEEREPRTRGRTKTAPKVQESASSLAFVRVDAETRSQASFELQLQGGRLLRIPQGLDEPTLRRLLSVLEGA